jgi:hypothetical protein
LWANTSDKINFKYLLADGAHCQAVPFMAGIGWTKACEAGDIQKEDA